MSNGSEGDAIVGRVLAGKYAIESLIRTGAMGRIYRARHLTLEKTVCVKVMHPTLAAEPHFVRRFHTEARATSRLDHDASVRVLDFGKEEDGVLYLVMEFLAGRDLYDVLQEDWPLPRQTVVGIVTQILSALAAAHDAGILHRDLKPENVMVLAGDDEGDFRVKVCDFGIAKMLDPEPSTSSGPEKCTTRGLIVGTPEYMSPEQAQGKDLDARSDLYSVGILLYQLLTGRVPFEGDTALSIVLRQVSDPPTPPSTLIPDVDSVLESVCLKALEKNPADRYASAREMRAAILQIASAPVQSKVDTAKLPKARPPTTLATLVERPSRIRQAVFVAGSIAVAAFGVHELPAQSAPRVPVVAEAKAAPATVVGRIASASDVLEGSAHAAVSPPAKTVAKEAPPVVASNEAAPAPVAAAATPEQPAEEAAPSPAPVQPSVNFAVSALPPPPAPSRIARAIVTPPPRYIVERARIEVGFPPTPLGATSANFQRSLTPAVPHILACYRGGLPASTGNAEGRGWVHVETNDVGVITRARFDGPIRASIGTCVERSVMGRKIANVDTGVAVADVPLTMSAH